MRLRVIDQGTASPLASHAVPYGIAAVMAIDAEPVLTLCTPSIAYVSVGIHQDAAEIDEDYCRARDIPVLRREVGGGAVLLDADQLYFHLVCPRRLAPERTERLFARFADPVVRTYADLGIVAAYRAPNDVVSNGRKLGATAAAEIGDALVLAGSLMFDFDSETMACCLRVSDEGFRAALRQGLADHLTTMRRLLPSLPPRGDLAARFAGHVAATVGADPQPDTPSPNEVAAIGEAAARHASADWLRRRGARLVPDGVKIAEGVHLSRTRRTLDVTLLEARGHIHRVELPAGLERLAERLKGAALHPGTALARRIEYEMAALGLCPAEIAAGELAAAILAARRLG